MLGFKQLNNINTVFGKTNRRRYNAKVITCFFSMTVSLFLFCTCLLHAQETHPNQINQEYQQALGLTGKHQYDEAIQRLKQIIGQDSSFYRAYIKLVEVYKYKKALDEAKNYFESHTTKSPDNPYAHHALGLILKEKKQWQDAYNHIIKALQLNNEYFAAYLDFVSVNAKIEWAEKNFTELIKTKPNIAAAHYGLAYIYSLLPRRNQQLKEAQKALKLNPDLLEAYFLLADANYWNGDYEQALKECQLGLKKAVAKVDPENQIELLKLRALIVNKMGEPENAIKNMTQALRLSQDIGDKDKEADSYNGLTRIYWYISQFLPALENAKNALDIEKELGDRLGQASNLNYMGIFSTGMGDYSKAVEYHEQAQKLFQEIGETGYSAISLGNLANVYFELGYDSKSLQLFEQSLELLNQSGSGWERMKAAYLIGLGKVQERLGNSEQALVYYERALQILKPMKTEAHQISFILGKFGRIYQTLGQYPLALKYYQQANEENLIIFDQLIKAPNMINIGSFYYTTKDNLKAEYYYREALKLGKQIENKEIIWQAEAGLGASHQQIGQYVDALQHYKRAIELIESIRSKLQLEIEKTGYLKNKIDVYADAVSVLSELNQQAPHSGHDLEAFQYAERAKARSLLDIVYEGRVFHNLTDISDDFRQKYLINRKELENKHLDLSRELSKPDDQKDQKIVFSLTNEIEMLQRDEAQLLQEIKEKYPSYYTLTNPVLLTASDIQRNILADNQLLLEYLVGEQQVFVWALTKEKLSFYTINLTRIQLAEKLAGISPIFKKEKSETPAKFDHRWANIRSDLLHDLYQTLVKNPAAELLKPDMELIIIPDDILFYFPFEILVTEFGQDKVEYLIEKHAVSYASSASLLNPKLHRTQETNRDLLAFGNPEFGVVHSKGILSWLSFLKPLRPILRGEGFEPLPYAELEVKNIAENFTEKAVFTGKEATETRLKEMASDFRYIHLATHNITDDSQPMYSKIILAKLENDKDDGYLQTYEVYNLQLNADLVVLSGCNTGLGKMSRGEGLIGVTRAFLYAGVPSLVVSLWPVNDESTAELMKHFYYNLKNGMAKNRALQKAKLKLIQSKDWKHDPFYWGAFVLIGN